MEDNRFIRNKNNEISTAKELSTIEVAKKKAHDNSLKYIQNILLMNGEILSDDTVENIAN